MKNHYLVLATLALATAASGQGRALTPEQMEADYFEMTEALLSQHGGLYRYTPAEEFDEVLGQALFEMSEERTTLEFFRVVSRVLATVRCGHTGVSLAPTWIFLTCS